MNSILEKKVLALLSHTVEFRAFSSKELEEELEIHAEELFECICGLMSKGEPLGFECEGQWPTFIDSDDLCYYRGQKPEDLDDTISMLRDYQVRLRQELCGLHSAQQQLRKSSRGKRA